MGKQSTPKTQTVVNKTELPPWVNSAAQSGLADAQTVANNLAAPYTGNQVAPFNQNQYDAWNMAFGGSAAAQPGLNAAQNALTGLTNYSPQQVSAPGVTGSNVAMPGAVSAQQIGAQQIGAAPQVGTSQVGTSLVGTHGIAGQQLAAGTSQVANGAPVQAGQFSADAMRKYMDPYAQSVIDASMKTLDQQRQLANNQTAGQAAGMGAFGGNRQAIQQAVTNSQTAMQAGQLAAQLNSSNFAQAAGLLGADQNWALQADTTNANNALTASQANAENALKASLANQATNLSSTTTDANNALTASQANAANTLDSSKANASNTLAASSANAGNWLQGALANQQSTLAADKANQAANLTAAQGNQQTALSAGLANQANALDASKANATNSIAAQAANQNAGLEGQKNRILGATQLASTAQQQMDNVLRQASVNEGIGDRLQSQDQAQLAQQAANYNALRNQDLERLNIKLAALGMVPYGQTSSTTGPATTQKSNPLLGALGGAATGASIASTLGLAGGSGGLIGSGLGGLMGLLALSDEDTKTDKQLVGKHPGTGLDLYAYRYKGDPKNTPKVVGPMAQDVARKFPQAVTRIPAARKGMKPKLAIKPGFLTGMGLAHPDAGRPPMPAAAEPPPTPHRSVPRGSFLAGTLAAR